MNPTKLLDEITSVASKYGPTLIVHLLLLVWISLRVLDPTSLPKADAVWTPLTERLDSSLKVVGLSLEPWYVLIALTIAYLVTFQWIRNLIMMLPPFRVSFSSRPSPKLLRYAAETLHMRPDLWKVEDALRTHVERASRELQEPDHPYSYLQSYERVNTWYPYYGTLLIAFVCVIFWLAEGSRYALSADRVRELGFILAVGCLGLRWKIVSEFRKRETALAYWVLNKLEKERDSQQADPLRSRRGELVEKQAYFQKAVMKHPSELLRRLIYRWLPEKAAIRISHRLPHPKWWLPLEDWDIFESEAMLYRDEMHHPPKALLVDDFVARFEPLLECTGAGLFMLVPSLLGLAPSVDQGGASYSLAMRHHGWGPLSVTLQADDNLEHPSLRVQSNSEAPSFLVEIGEIAIEQLAQGEFPYKPEADWHRLAYGKIEAKDWTAIGNREQVIHRGLSLANSVDLHLGSSYLLGTRTSLGTCVSAVIQCFQVASTPKLIVAWRIINVTTAKAAMPEVLPWWKPAAWSDAIRSIRNDSR